jgi:hypothetical protein
LIIFLIYDVEVVEACNSDHLPLVVALDSTRANTNIRPRVFRYAAGWGKHKENKETIKKIWRVKKTQNNSWAQVKNKLETSKKAIVQWRKKKVQEGDRGVEEKIGRLKNLQEQGGVEVQEDITLLQSEINNILEKEDLKWKQLAKEHWLKLGDKNTKYYHACVNQKRRANTIDQIMDMNGRQCSTDHEIKDAFVNYFGGIFSTSYPNYMDRCFEDLTMKLSTDMNNMLLQPCTYEEVSAAVGQMADLKAPGCDGLPTEFFHDNWSTIGQEIFSVVSDFFSTSRSDDEINLTVISLIPKIASPTKVSEFRPISLCNVFYKIISKTLANRLKVILPVIISANQSAFIPGRLITDNVLVAYETLHSMHTRMWGKTGYMAIKLDMSKAYDRVEWVFLVEVMKKLGFAEKWVELIMKCVTTVKYSVIVNGEVTGKICPTRGIRQWDPLSPYLFLLCAEALSAQLANAERTGFLKGVPTSPKGPRINHLFFADESLLFCRATPAEWHRLEGILELYERASGQMLNRDKTSVFFSRNTDDPVKEIILRLAGVLATQRYDKYLSLPALVGKSRIREFQSIKDRVRHRVNDWKTKFLSQAGK